jgi:hypothetical protein
VRFRGKRSVQRSQKGLLSVQRAQKICGLEVMLSRQLNVKIAKLGKKDIG